MTIAIKRAARRSSMWVTKTDVRRYKVCPYAFWLIDSGAVDLDELLGTGDAVAELERINSGEGFERDVLDRIDVLPEGVKPEDVGVRYLYGGPTVTNEDLSIAGRPDGIDLKYHAPIEIKAHSIPTPLDELELAFYWKLLDPQRKTHDVEPFGYLQLRSKSRKHDGCMVRVLLRDQLFAEIDRLIAGVRRARQTGVRPRACYCFVCQTRTEVQAIIEEGCDVRLIWGVGRQHAETLYALDVTTIEALAAADLDELVERMHELRGNSVSVRNVVSWQHHARSLLLREPVRFRAGCIEASTYIVLDLEYDPMGGGIYGDGIWLYGALYHDANGNEELFQRWTPTRRESIAALRALSTFIAKYPNAPIVTYSGTAADLPQLRGAARGLKTDVVEQIETRHVDVMQLIAGSVRFPTYDLGLKSLGDVLQFERKSNIRNGLEAMMLFEKWRHTKSVRMKAMHRSALLRYNHEDLAAAVVVIEHLRTLPLHPEAAAAHVLAEERRAEARRERRREQKQRKRDLALAKLLLGDDMPTPSR